MRKLIIGCLMMCLAMATPVAFAQNRPNAPQNGRVNRGFRQEVMRWASQYMPNLAQLASDPQDRNAFFSDAIARFRAYQNAHEDKAKEKVLSSCKQEDEIFGYVLALHQAPEEEKPAILEKISLLTRQFVEGILTERGGHIEALKNQIQEQEQKLAEDRKNIDELVASRVNSRFLKPATRPASDTPSNSSQPSSTPSRGDGTLAAPQSP